MNQYEKFAENHILGHDVKLSVSPVIERMLLVQGAVFYNALIEATTAEELEVIMASIGEYTTLCSYYAFGTDRITESLGVDLNVAALYKYELTTQGKDNEWHHFARQFRKALVEDAKYVGINLPDMSTI